MVPREKRLILHPILFFLEDGGRKQHPFRVILRGFAQKTELLKTVQPPTDFYFG